MEGAAKTEGRREPTAGGWKRWAGGGAAKRRVAGRGSEEMEGEKEGKGQGVLGRKYVHEV